MLLHITDIYTNGFLPDILNVFFFAAVLFGVLVITTKSPVIAILYLIALFGSISLYLFSVELVFLALAYLLVYVGAVSILFLFILMLIDVRISELHSGTKNSLFLGVLIGIFFFYPVNQLLPTGSIESFEEAILGILDYIYGFGSVSKDISYVTTALWDGNLTQNTHISSIGNIMFTSYAAWLIITSLILLLAMVGAIVITIKQTNISYASRALNSDHIINLTLKSSISFIMIFSSNN